MSAESSFFVVPFDPSVDTLLALDFTAGNKELTDEVISDTSKFAAFVEKKLAASAARYGIGGYGEHRTVYSRSAVFNGIGEEEPRRLHLGLDIWGKAGTSVFSILDGKVHSFAFNNRSGDYGATIILEHEWKGESLFSLYGHLALRDLEEIREGDSVSRGQLIAHFGEAKENGNWPPHLHLQLIRDMQGFKGDYPGVCRFSEREGWLQNCPNPHQLAGFGSFVP